MRERNYNNESDILEQIIEEKRRKGLLPKTTYTREEVLDMFYMIRNKIWHEPKYFPTYANHGKSYIECDFVTRLIQDQIDKLRGEDGNDD